MLLGSFRLMALFQEFSFESRRLDCPVYSSCFINVRWWCAVWIFNQMMLSQDCLHAIYAWIIFVWKSAVRLALCDFRRRNSISTFCVCQTSDLNRVVGKCASEVFYVESNVRVTFFLKNWDDLPTDGASGWPHGAAALKETSRNPLGTSKYGSHNFRYSVFCGGNVHARIRPRTESCKMKQSLFSTNLNIAENITEGGKLNITTYGRRGVTFCLLLIACFAFKKDNMYESIKQISVLCGHSDGAFGHQWDSSFMSTAPSSRYR